MELKEALHGLCSMLNPWSWAVKVNQCPSPSTGQWMPETGCQRLQRTGRSYMEPLTVSVSLPCCWGCPSSLLAPSSSPASWGRQVGFHVFNVYFIISFLQNTSWDATHRVNLFKRICQLVISLTGFTWNWTGREQNRWHSKILKIKTNKQKRVIVRSYTAMPQIYYQQGDQKEFTYLVTSCCSRDTLGT